MPGLFYYTRKIILPQINLRIWNRRKCRLWIGEVGNEIEAGWHIRRYSIKFHNEMHRQNKIE